MVQAKAVPLCHLGHGDLALTLTADDDHLVPDRGFRHRGEVNPRVLERRRGHDGHAAAVPMGMTPSRMGAVTGNGALSAKRSRGTSSFTVMIREVSARNVGASGTGEVSPGNVMP